MTVRGPDVKTFISASVFLLVLTICVGFWQRGETFEDTTDALNHVIGQNDDLRDDNKDLAADLRRMQRRQDADARAAKERYDALVEREAALLRYLRAHGIEIPTRFITVGGGSASKGTHSPSGSRRNPGGSGPQTGSGKDIPGKAKGHHHQPRNPGHRRSR